MVSTQQQQEQARKHIKVTEHPTIPCSKTYEDIFSSIIVKCEHPEHNQSLLNNKNKNGQDGLNPDLVGQMDSTDGTITAGLKYYDRQT